MKMASALSFAIIAAVGLIVVLAADEIEDRGFRSMINSWTRGRLFKSHAKNSHIKTTAATQAATAAAQATVPQREQEPSGNQKLNSDCNCGRPKRTAQSVGLILEWMAVFVDKEIAISDVTKYHYGTVIGAKLVITTLNDYNNKLDKKKHHVYIGVINLNLIGNQMARVIDEIIVEPNQDNRRIKTALAILKEALTFDENFGPICLPPVNCQNFGMIAASVTQEHDITDERGASTGNRKTVFSFVKVILAKWHYNNLDEPLMISVNNAFRETANQGESVVAPGSAFMAVPSMRMFLMGVEDYFWKPEKSNIGFQYVNSQSTRNWLANIARDYGSEMCQRAFS